MIICGIDIKGSDAILCLLAKDNALFTLLDCRQVRISLVNDHQSENLKQFQFTVKKLFEDYKVTHAVIKERPTKGKFAGGAVGFKIESAIQLIDTTEVELLNSATIKSRIKHTPIPVPFKATGLKAFQEGAFTVAYAAFCGNNPAP